MVPLIWVFLVGFITDVFWAWYIQWTASKKKYRAAAASMGCALCGLVGTGAALSEHHLAIPYLVGIGLGTVIGVGGEPPTSEVFVSGYPFLEENDPVD